MNEYSLAKVQYFIKTTGKVTVFCHKITIFAAIIKIV